MSSFERQTEIHPARLIAKMQTDVLDAVTGTQERVYARKLRIAQDKRVECH